MRRIADGFLSVNVLGKWGTYCGVRSILVEDRYYILEGCLADGYMLLSVPDALINEAAGEVCEAAVLEYIESRVCTMIYKEDGTGYKKYLPNIEGFVHVEDDQILTKVRTQAAWLGIKGDILHS